MVRLTEKLYRSARLRGAGVIDSAADAAGGASGATVPFASNSAANEQWMFHGTHSTPPQRVYSSHSGFDMRMSKDGCVLCASVACGSELPRWNALTVCVGCRRPLPLLFSIDLRQPAASQPPDVRAHRGPASVARLNTTSFTLSKWHRRSSCARTPTPTATCRNRDKAPCQCTPFSLAILYPIAPNCTAILSRRLLETTVALRLRL